MGAITVTDTETKLGRSLAVLCLCACGWEGYIRYKDLPNRTACAGCQSSARMKVRMNTPEGATHQRRMTERARLVDTSKWTKEEKRIARVMGSARQRCTNPNSAAYPDYGGRGIRFAFDSVEHATRWVIDNIGHAPTPEHTLDRVGNNQHYEPGNLRWATRAEQNANKRAYKNALPQLPLAKSLRPDLSDSQIRALLKQGRTIDEIRGWVKYASSRVRHS